MTNISLEDEEIKLLIGGLDTRKLQIEYIFKNNENSIDRARNLISESDLIDKVRSKLTGGLEKDEISND